MSKNRREWLTLDIACLLYNNCIVPFYDTYKTETISYVVEKSALTTMFISKDLLKQFIGMEKHDLKNLVCWSIDYSPEEAKWAEELKSEGYNIFSYEEVIDSGKKIPKATK